MLFFPSELGVAWVFLGIFLGISLGLRPREIPRKTQATPPSDGKNITFHKKNKEQEFIYIASMPAMHNPSVIGHLEGDWHISGIKTPRDVCFTGAHLYGHDTCHAE